MTTVVQALVSLTDPAWAPVVCFQHSRCGEAVGKRDVISPTEFKKQCVCMCIYVYMYIRQFSNVSFSLKPTKWAGRWWCMRVQHGHSGQPCCRGEGQCGLWAKWVIRRWDNSFLLPSEASKRISAAYIFKSSQQLNVFNPTYFYLIYYIKVCKLKMKTSCILCCRTQALFFSYTLLITDVY